MHSDDEQNKLCFAVLSLGSRSWEHFGFAFQVPKQTKTTEATVFCTFTPGSIVMLPTDRKIIGVFSFPFTKATFVPVKV